MDEFYSMDEIMNMLHTRLHESIDYNSKSLAMYDIPQIIKDYTKTKIDSQLLESLINTNYISKSNLTQNNKLANVKKDSVVINTTPQITASVIVPPAQPQPITQTMETLEPVVTSGGIGSGGARYMQNYMEGQTIDRLTQEGYK